MSEWHATTLGELMDISHGFAFKGEFFSEGGDTRLVTPGNFYEAGGFRDRGDKQKSYDGPVPERYVLEPGDVVVAMTEQAAGLLGSSGIVPSTGRWLHNQRIGRVDIREGAADKRFVYYLFNTPAVRAQISATATGAKVRHTAPERILSVCAAVPSPGVQAHVGAVLAAFDELIAINARRIELLEGVARSLYREWFVRFRFPGHDGDVEDGAIPQGWIAARVADVASVNATTAKPRDLPDPLDYIDISSVSPRRIDSATRMSASEAPGRARRVIRDGDTLWAMVRPNRRSHALVHDPPPAGIASTGFAVLTPRGVPAAFLFEYASRQEFTDYLVGRATGAAYPAVRPGDFDEAPIVVPPPALLTAFADAADPALRLASHLIGTNRGLARTRDLLLPRLISGRLDIADVDLGDLFLAEAA